MSKTTVAGIVQWASTSFGRAIVKLTDVISGAKAIANLQANSRLHVTSAVLVTGLWVLLCRSLRYERRDALLRKWQHRRTKDGYDLTPHEAQEILNVVANYEFPTTYLKALQGTLIQTYQIPTIATLLRKTGQLSSFGQTCMYKRAVDTGVLNNEMVKHPLDSERSTMATQRIKWLHARYGPAISNDDLRFVLSGDLHEPFRVIDRIEWRTTTDLEKIASYIVFREIAKRWEIKDIPPSYTEYQEWAEKYQDDFAAPTQACVELTEAALQLTLSGSSAPLRPAIRAILIAMMPPTLRMAAGLPEPSRLTMTTLQAVLAVRRFILRNFCLPRSKSAISLAEKPSSNGNYHLQQYKYQPWYIEPSLYNRIVAYMKGYTLGPDLRSEGYQIERLGPEKYEGKGIAEIRAAAEAAQKAKLADVRCPARL